MNATFTDVSRAWLISDDRPSCYCIREHSDVGQTNDNSIGTDIMLFTIKRACRYVERNDWLVNDFDAVSCDDKCAEVDQFTRVYSVYLAGARTGSVCDGLRSFYDLSRMASHRHRLLKFQFPSERIQKLRDHYVRLDLRRGCFLKNIAP